MADTLEDIATAPLDIAKAAVSGDPGKEAESLFAPSLILDQHPGIVGAGSKVADAIASIYAGGPALEGLLGPATGATDAAVNIATDAAPTIVEEGGLPSAEALLSQSPDLAQLGGAAATSGAGSAIANSIPEIVVNGALPSASGAGVGGLLPELAGAASGVAGSLAGGGFGGTAAPGASTGAPAGSPGSGATPSQGAAPVSATPGGSTGGAVGGSTSPSVANAAPGSDIGGPGGGNDLFNVKPVDANGVYKAPGSDYLQFGSTGQPTNVPVSDNSGFFDKLFGGAAGGSGGSGASSGGTIGSKISAGIFGGAPTSTANEIVGALPSVLPAAYTAIKGEQTPKGYDALSSQATQLSSQGQAMAAYLQNGTLPAGVKTALDTAKNSAIASIKSSYAARGQSGSSAEMEDIAAAEQQIVGQGAGVAMNLFQQGVSEQQIAGQLQESLLNTTIQQDAQFSQALGSFASALAGGGGSNSNLKISVA